MAIQPQAGRTKPKTQSELLSSGGSSYKKRHIGSIASKPPLIPACNQSELYRIDRRKWSRGADVLQRSTANSAIDRRPSDGGPQHHAIDPVMKFLRSSAFTVGVASIQQQDSGRQISIYMKWETLDDFRSSSRGWPTLRFPIDWIQEKGPATLRGAPMEPRST